MGLGSNVYDIIFLNIDPSYLKLNIYILRRKFTEYMKAFYFANIKIVKIAGGIKPDYNLI
jgi:hypothetical protein